MADTNAKGIACGKNDGHTRYPAPSPVTVHLQPHDKTVLLQRARSVRSVLTQLELRPGMAIVARQGELLTPDRAVSPGDSLMVRMVMSSG
jgi:sulfur carrier protein ThiS